MVGPNIPAHLLPAVGPVEDEDQTEQGSTEDAVQIGPQIPSQTLSGPAPRFSPPSQSQPQEDEDEEEDDYVPALPPDMLAARSAGPSAPSSSSAKPAEKRVIGPALPPSLAHRPRTYEERDDDDDDDYGPAPLPAGAQVEERDGVQEFLEKEEKRRKRLEEASKPKALKREEWMLVPPSSSDLLGSIDPTKQKRPRQFARTAQPSRDTDTSLWTETPAERQQRLADEVAGKRRRVTDVQSVDPEEERELRKRRRHEEEVRRGVEEHTRKVRGGTLLNQHAAASKNSKEEEEEEEEGPPKIWDHSRDMALSGRLMDDKSREKFIKEARGLGDRFGTGKSGGFL